MSSSIALFKDAIHVMKYYNFKTSARSILFCKHNRLVGNSSVLTYYFKVAKKFHRKIKKTKILSSKQNAK